MNWRINGAYVGKYILVTKDLCPKFEIDIKIFLSYEQIQ